MPTFRTVMMSDIERCPIRAMSASHYRDDGSCDCVPPADEHPDSEGVVPGSLPATLDEDELPTAIVTLCRLSSACMEQARWFASGPERPGQPDHPRNMPRASQWAARGEELLEWLFEYFDDSKEPKGKAANRIAWLLLRYEPDQEVT